jgi:hypothetical protein
MSTTRAVRGAAGQFARGLDTGQARADDDDRVGSGVGGTVGQCGEMTTQLHRAVKGVDVETEFGQAGDVGLDQLAAQSDDQPVIGV